MQLDSTLPADAPRFAFITSVLEMGGSTTFLCNLGGELVRRRVPVVVFSFERANPLAANFERLGVPVSVQNQDRLIYEDRIGSILEQLSKFQPTVVVACLSSVSFEVLRYSPRGVDRVGMVQSDDPGVYRLVRQYAEHMDRVVGVSKTIVEKLESFPELADVPSVYGPYGVPMPPQARVREHTTNNPLRILYLGRVDDEQKRVRLFPGILSDLCASRMPFVWTVAGNGPDRSYLERTMVTNDPSQVVRFTGMVSYERVPELLESHDVFLLASDYEGLPLSLLEAMGHGLVPVVSDLPSGVREVVDETTGKLVDIHDIPGYARAILWLHEHRREMTQMAQRAREKVQARFSVAAMTDRWLELGQRCKAAEMTWPREFNIEPMMGARRPFYYREPVRTMRRLRKKCVRRF